MASSDFAVGPPNKPEYLGDGLYAEYDGDQVRLFASDGITTSNEVFLDSATLRAFIRYIEVIRENNGR